MARRRVAVLVGSVRKNSQTIRAARIVAEELEQRGIDVDLVDPRSLDLKLPGLEEDKGAANDLQRRVGACDAAIMVTPEYDGTFSSVMKLLIEHLGYPSVLAGKPVHLLGVAAGRIGAIKALEHLRSVCGSIGSLLLPNSKSVAYINKIFDEQGRPTDPAAERIMRDVAREMAAHLGA